MRLSGRRKIYSADLWRSDDEAAAFAALALEVAEMDEMAS